MTQKAEKITVENINCPGQITNVDKAKYEAMRSALLAVLPSQSPGLTAAEAKENLKPLLPQNLFPNGEKSGWWLKCIQLDLEAKGLVHREATKPLRFFKL